MMLYDRPAGPCARRAAALLGTLIAIAAAPSARAADADTEIKAAADRELPSLVHYYEALHANPELSRLEEHTSADLARQLRAVGFEVTEHVGQYALPGYRGYGVVALLRNEIGRAHV